jgi:hypothetical protein
MQPNVPLIERHGLQPIVLHRRLPRPGRVLYQVGDRVQPEDVVATCLMPTGPVVVPVAAGLGVPAGAAVKSLVKPLGENVQPGEVVAAKRGLLGGRELTAPAAGRLIAVEAGNLLIQAEPAEHSLMALVPGQVSAIEPERGVTLTARGQAFRGVACSPGETWGRLTVWGPADRPEDSETAIGMVAHLDLAVAQVMAGATQGVVAGTIAPPAVAWLQSAGRGALGPVLALNGVGDADTPPEAWRARLELAGHFGTLVVGDPALHPAGEAILVIAQPQVRGELPAFPDTLAVGTLVRASAGPTAGRYGTVVALPKQASRLESGRSAAVAVVAYGEERRVEPLVNLVQIAPPPAGAPRH